MKNIKFNVLAVLFAILTVSGLSNPAHASGFDYDKTLQCLKDMDQGKRPQLIIVLEESAKNVNAAYVIDLLEKMSSYTGGFDLTRVSEENYAYPKAVRTRLAYTKRANATQYEALMITLNDISQKSFVYGVFCDYPCAPGTDVGHRGYK